MLRVAGLEARYGRIPALKGIDLAVSAGELVALVGGNGAGKSTLLRALSGVQPCSGKILFARAEIQSLPPERRVALGMVQVPEGRQVFGPLSVEDNLRLGAYRRGRAHAAATLGRVYAMFPVLAERRRQTAGTLSGGEQQMLAMGRALMSNPRYLLLDEPSLGLAPQLVGSIRDLISAINEQGTTVLLVEQNASMALSIADHGYVMETGRVVMDKPAAALLDDEDIKEFYLGLGAEGSEKSFRDVKHYRRRKRWLS